MSTCATDASTTDAKNELTLVPGESQATGKPHQAIRPKEPVSPRDEPEIPGPINGAELLDEVRAWLARYLRTVTEEDLDLMAVWIVHTYLVTELYTTPRLLIDSPMPGSGKTTALEHIAHLAYHPVQMATVSSPAMLTRMLDAGRRTMLIDEADRSLRPDAPGTQDILAVLNSGYKRGATRPVLVADKENGWVTRELPTHCPVAMAGNNPRLPEDTRTRTIRILLLPDMDGTVEESDWELIESEAKALAARIAAWAAQVRDQIADTRPPMPEGITGRLREKWLPLKRIATAAGRDWPDRVDAMALADKEQVVADREDGMITARPHMVLLGHLAELWPEGEDFMPTTTLVDELVRRYPEVWGRNSSYGSTLTAKRLAKMLAGNFKINSKYRTSSHVGPKGYRARELAEVMKRMGYALPVEGTQAPQAPERPQQGNLDGDHRDHREGGDHLSDITADPQPGLEDRTDSDLADEDLRQDLPKQVWVEDLDEGFPEDWYHPSEDYIRELY